MKEAYLQTRSVDALYKFLKSRGADIEDRRENKKATALMNGVPILEKSSVPEGEIWKMENGKIMEKYKF